MPPLASLSKVLYTFSVSCFSKSKECLKVVKVLPDPCPEFTFQDDRISQKVLKEKQVLKQDTLLLQSLSKNISLSNMSCFVVQSSSLGLKKKTKGCSFLLLENSRPYFLLERPRLLSPPWGPWTSYQPT